MNRVTVAAIGFALIVGYFVWTEHSAHVAQALPYLPWLLLLACPLLHIFMHGSHGGGHGHRDRYEHNVRQDAPTPTTHDAQRPPHQQQIGDRHE